MEWIYIVNHCLLSASIFLKVTAATEMCCFLSSSCSYDCPFLSPRSCTRSRSSISRQGSRPIYCYLCDNRNLTCFLTSWAFCFQKLSDNYDSNNQTGLQERANKYWCVQAKQQGLWYRVSVEYIFAMKISIITASLDSLVETSW